MKIFPGGHLTTTAALLSPIFWLQGHIPNQKITMRIIHPRWYWPTPLAHGLTGWNFTESYWINLHRRRSNSHRTTQSPKLETSLDCFIWNIEICLLVILGNIPFGISSQNINGWNFPDSKVHGANMGPIWGRHDPGGPHVGPMNFVIWVHRILLAKFSHEETKLSQNHTSSCPRKFTGLIFGKFSHSGLLLMKLWTILPDISLYNVSVWGFKEPDFLNFHRWHGILTEPKQPPYDTKHHLIAICETWDIPTGNTSQNLTEHFFTKCHCTKLAVYNWLNLHR